MRAHNSQAERAAETRAQLWRVAGERRAPPIQEHSAQHSSILKTRQTPTLVFALFRPHPPSSSCVANGAAADAVPCTCTCMVLFRRHGPNFFEVPAREWYSSHSRRRVTRCRLRYHALTILRHPPGGRSGILWYATHGVQLPVLGRFPHSYEHTIRHDTLRHARYLCTAFAQ